MNKPHRLNTRYREGRCRTMALEILEGRRLLTGPAVDGLDPAAGVHTAPLDTDVSAQFDQPLAPASVSDATFAVHAMQSGRLLQSDSLFTVDGNTVTVNPAADFHPGELIRATATTGIQNPQGEAADPYVWQFRTEVTAGTGVFVDTGEYLGPSMRDTSAIGLGDLDGDGDLDAFLGHGGYQGSSVWLNDGQGHLFSRTGRMSDDWVAGVALGDLDGDGDLDAFTANCFTRSGEDFNRVWLNDGEARFTDSGQRLGHDHDEDVILADLDGDGDLDAFVAGSDTIWFNDGQGGFTDSGQDLDGYNTREVALGDLDGDDDLDALVGSFGGSNRVWLNDGQGQFTDTGQALDGRWTTDVALGDLDGDGDLDAFVTNVGFDEAGAPNEVFFNDGEGHFSNGGQQMGDLRSRDVALRDLDRDGDLDAFVANHDHSDGAPNKLWLNDGQGHFSDSGQNLGHLASAVVVLGDLDGDGNVDAFVGNLGNSHGPNKIWMNDGQGHFSDSGQSLKGNIYDVALGDLDGDRDLDAFVANRGSDYSGGPDKVWLNDGQAHFTDSGQSLGDLPSRSVALGDLDGDGDLDAFVANGAYYIHYDPPRFEGPNTVWVNDGTGRFSDSGQRLGESNSYSVALGDLDADGDLDALVGNEPALIDGQYVDRGGDRVWLNDGQGHFTDSGQSLDELVYSQAVALADLDDDGDLDAFIVCAYKSGGGHQVAWPNKVWLNDGLGNFTDSGQGLNSSEHSAAVALGDVDGDGDIDALIAVTERDVGNFLWLNDGQAHFTDSGQHLEVDKPAALADLDGDGDLDALASASLWRNDGQGNFSESGWGPSGYNVALGDLDGDGALDVFSPNGLDGSAVWLNEWPEPYPGDANLDGVTDVRDFNIWNAHKFTSGTTWRQGNFNGDTVTDVRDFNIWNAHKFTSPTSPLPVDVVLAEPDTPISKNPETDLGNLAWIYDVEQANTGQRSSDDASRAEAAVDKLLATYWP